MSPMPFINFLRGIFKTKLSSETPHHAVIQSLYDSFVMVDGDLDLFRLELCLSTASGIWLDYWGDFFTIYRKSGEKDDAYAKRIIDSLTKPKATIPAIKEHIVDFLNERYHTDYTTGDVSIREPWKDIGKLSHKGRLSDATRFFSGDYYSHSVIDISVPEEITSDLIDLVSAIKAAGVKVVWSFLNTYDVITGFGDANGVWGQHARHILTQVPRNIFGGLVLSNSTPSPYLSGRRETWFELTNSYYWYARMLDKDTDNSVIITNKDLAGMLEYFEVDELLTEIRDTGAKLSLNSRLSDEKQISGEKTFTELVTKAIKVTQDMWDTIKFVDDWLTLSHIGQLSQKDATLFKFEAPHELYSKLLAYIEKFKKEHRDYYNQLQPPVITAEHIAFWYAARNNNWLFDTPTMSQEDFYEYWGLSPAENRTLQDIFDYEQLSDKRYLTFGDVYQPPIVIAGSPWDWTPIMDSPWLWDSAVLNNDELEEIYRRKFSGFPDMVEIKTQITTHPENNFNLSDNAVLSPNEYKYQEVLKRSSVPSLRLSDDGKLNEKRVSGEEITIEFEKLPNEDFKGYKYISGDASIITKHRIVTENVPELGLLIDFEENQRVDNPNEEIKYSTRDWFQPPVQVGDYAMWLVAPLMSQLWDTIAITNNEIMAHWNSPEGLADLAVLPTNFEETHLIDERRYQLPIVRADQPFYWLNDHSEFDEEWLWSSGTLNWEDLQEAYLTKFSDNMEMFPDLITTKTIINKTPEVEFRLSDNGYMPINDEEVEITVTKHLENAFRLSDNAVISNRKTEQRYHFEEKHFPENSFRLSDNGKISNFPRIVEIEEIVHSEDNFKLSESRLDSHFQISGGDIEEKHNLVDNPEYANDYKLSGDLPEITKTVEEVTYEELPLKYMSGTLSEVEVKHTPIPDPNGVHYLSGTKFTSYEQVSIEEHPITLGAIIELEEKQTKFPYSSRWVLQSPVQVGTFVPFLIKVPYPSLWNSVVISNSEIWELCRDTNYNELEQQMVENQYHPPFERADEPFYWIVPRLRDHQLWNTIAIPNDEIKRFWNSSEGTTPLSEVPYNFGAMIVLDEKRYQLPIVRTDEPFYWITRRLKDPQLWNTIAMTNEDIMSYWNSPEGAADVSTLPKNFEETHLADERRYQPPIVRADQPFYWVNDHDEFDHMGWLWDAGTLTNEELEEIYQAKFSHNPDAFPNTTTIEIRPIKNRPTQFKLSHNGELSGVNLKTEKIETKHLENAFRLSDNAVISNRKTEYRTHTEVIYHSENSFRLSDNHAVLSPQAKIIHYDLESHPEEQFVLSADTGRLNTTQRISGRKTELIETLVENPEFKGYTLVSGNVPEIKKTIEEITYPELKLTYMSGEKTDVKEYTTIDKVYGYKQLLSGGYSQTETVVVVTENSPTLGRLIELEESQKYKYSIRDIFQSPIQIQAAHVANWRINMEYPILWNSPTITNKDILRLSSHTSLVYLEPELFETLLRFQPPFMMTGTRTYKEIKAGYNKLWNTPVMTNTAIVNYWDNGAVTPEEYETNYLSDDDFHTPPFYQHRWFKVNSLATNRDLVADWIVINRAFGLDVVDAKWDMTMDPVLVDRWFRIMMTASDRNFKPELITIDRWFRLNSLAADRDGKPLFLFTARNYELTSDATYPNRINSVLHGRNSELFAKVKDDAWLWDSSVLTNGELEAIYEDKLGISDAILKVILDYEENDTEYGYSTRGILQPPIERVTYIEYSEEFEYLVANYDAKILDANLDSRFDYEAKMPQEGWLFDSNLFTTDDLEGLYANKLGVSDFILKTILDYEDNQPETNYSTKGESQPPVQTTEL